MTNNSTLPAFHVPESFSMQGSDGHGLTKREYAMIHLCAGFAANGKGPLDETAIIMIASVVDNIFKEIES